MMTELSTDLGLPEDSEPVVSTQLDHVGKTTEATPAKEAPEVKAKPESRLDAIKRAAADVNKAAPTKEPAKEPEKDGADKEVLANEGDPVVAKEAEPAKEAPARRQHIEAPDKFLPRAKELWQNVPHEVRSDMQRVIAEAETEATQARESVKEYEAVKPFAEMARRSGTTIDQALSRYVGMEQALRSDPTSGFRALGQNMQMTPVQMIGHVMAAHGIQPQQLVQHMANAPHEYTALARPQPQQQQPSNEVETLKQQLAQIQQQQAQDRVESTIIAPFAAENPRYRELEGKIASFLNSDIIPRSLSPHDRLAAAYDMAVRISPPSQRQPAPVQAEAEQAQEGRAGRDFGGDKSVRGAPASGVDTSSRSRGKMSRQDALKAAFAELGVAH